MFVLFQATDEWKRIFLKDLFAIDALRAISFIFHKHTKSDLCTVL